MAFEFGSLIFTSAIKALQEKYGSRAQYARREKAGWTADPIGPDETDFIGDRDSFYIATVGEGGWPYVQHRGDVKGFLKVIDECTIAFADFRGNKQYITAGNLATDDRVALILVDYPRRARLKILGHAHIFEGKEAEPWIAKLGQTGGGTIERVFAIDVKATDWNCQQHIVPRFTQDELRDVLAPWLKKCEALRQENQSLRQQLGLPRADVAEAG